MRICEICREDFLEFADAVICPLCELGAGRQELDFSWPPIHPVFGAGSFSWLGSEEENDAPVFVSFLPRSEFDAVAAGLSESDRAQFSDLLIRLSEVT